MKTGFQSNLSVVAIQVTEALSLVGFFLSLTKLQFGIVLLNLTKQFFIIQGICFGMSSLIYKNTLLIPVE